MSVHPRSAIRVCLYVLCGLIFRAGSPLAFAEQPPAPRLVRTSQIFLARLDAEQRQVALLPFESPLRLDWSAGAKPFRKGLHFGCMNPEQREAAVEMLRSLLSPAGFVRVRHSMQAPAKHFAGSETSRDADSEGARYHITFFGLPDDLSRWGLSVEGAHLSLNFVIAEGLIVSSTPQLFSAREDLVLERSVLDTGRHALAVEAEIARQLVAGMSPERLTAIVYSPQAPTDPFSIGDPQPPLTEPDGISLDNLDETRRILVRSLIEETCRAMPAAVANERLAVIAEAGWERVHVGWAGSTDSGQPHSLRIQGPTFLLEFVAASSNDENVVDSYQCLWRSRRGDFALPLVEGVP